MAPVENEPHFDMNFFQGQIKITQDFIFGRKCENIIAGNDPAVKLQNKNVIVEIKYKMKWGASL